MRKKLISIGIILLMYAGVLLVAVLGIPMKSMESPEGKEAEVSTFDKESVYVWYSDDTLTNYLSSAAVAYNEANSTRVVPVLKSPLEYLEAINEATVNNEAPDAYILPHSSLTKAYKAGLADEISLSVEEFSRNYIGQAENSVLYKDKHIGYPVFFETPVLLYNETYLTQLVDAKNAEITAPVESEEDSENEDATDGEASDAQKLVTIDDLIPATFEDIKDIAENYDAPEGVEAFMRWDVTDIFFNYFFLGDAINVGGPAGWDLNQIDIYNKNAIECITEYQKLNQFFSIDSSNSNYQQVVQDFLDGKILYTIATTDVINTLETAKADGTFAYDYGVSLIPDMNEEIDTRAMSITHCLVVNPFANHIDIANDFGRFVSVDYADNMYSKSQKVSVSKNVTYDSGAFDIFAMEYGYSAPLPKMMETSNMWVQLEAAFKDVWDGENPNEALKALAEKLAYQVTGETVKLDTIELPAEEDDTEYDAW